jgi:hypothetical protein
METKYETRLKHFENFERFFLVVKENLETSCNIPSALVSYIRLYLWEPFPFFECHQTTCVLGNVQLLPSNLCEEFYLLVSQWSTSSVFPSEKNSVKPFKVSAWFEHIHVDSRLFDITDEKILVPYKVCFHYVQYPYSSLDNFIHQEAIIHVLQKHYPQVDRKQIIIHSYFIEERNEIWERENVVQKEDVLDDLSSLGKRIESYAAASKFLSRKELARFLFEMRHHFEALLGVNLTPRYKRRIVASRAQHN